MVKLNHPWRILLKQQISDITDFLTFNDLPKTGLLFTAGAVNFAPVGLSGSINGQ